MLNLHSVRKLHKLDKDIDIDREEEVEMEVNTPIDAYPIFANTLQLLLYISFFLA